MAAGLNGRRRLLPLIGWALLALAFFLALRADEARREWIRVEGEIVGFAGDDSRAPVVEYVTPEGETRRKTGDVASNPRAGKVGDRVPVLINPDDPETVRLGTPLELWFLPGLLGAMGGLFVMVLTLTSAAAGGGRLPGQPGARRLQRLRETGERVMARVTAIVPVRAAAASGGPAYWRLEARSVNPPTGAPERFVSQPISVDPAPHIKVGDEIGVYVDRGDPKIYAFDFSMLPFGS